MTTKSPTNTRKTPRAAARPTNAPHFHFTAVEPLNHGVRVRPKKVRAYAKTMPALRRKSSPQSSRHSADVEVRVSPSASDTWCELVTLVTTAAVDRLSSVPEPERGQLLTNLRETLAEEGAETASAEVLAALRRVARTSQRTQDDLPAANRAALERAYQRAEDSQATLLKRPDMLTGEQLAKRTGLSRGTIDNRRKSHKLLALELGTKRGVRYPAWQTKLVTDVSTRRAFESTLAALAAVGPWSRYRFFTTAQPQLAGRTPIDALQTGEGDIVQRAADTWSAGEQGGH